MNSNLSNRRKEEHLYSYLALSKKTCSELGMGHCSQRGLAETESRRKKTLEEIGLLEIGKRTMLQEVLTLQWQLGSEFPSLSDTVTKRDT